MLLKFLAFCMAVALLSGCQQEPDMLRVGSNVWPGYEPFYVARELGHYQDEAIRLVEFPDASSVMEAMRSGRLEGAAVTLDEALLLASEGMALNIVMICDYSAGGDVVVARDDIQHATQLRHRRIAVETSAVGSLMLQSMLESARLTPEEVEVVHMPASAVATAWHKETIDAAITFTPHHYPLLEEGGRVVFSSADIPHRIVDVLIIKRRVVDDYEDEIHALIDGFHKAWQRLDNGNLIALNAAARRLKMPPEQVTQAWQDLQIASLQDNLNALQTAAEGNSPLLRNAAMLSELMQASGLLQRLPDNLIQSDARFIREAR